MKLLTPILLLFATTLPLLGLSSQPVRDGQVAVELVTPQASAAPGDSIAVGVRFRIDEDWHIYWRGIGDTGLPTEINWTLPEGVEAGPLHWPYPELYRNAHLVDYVYYDPVTLYMEITIPADWPVGKDFPITAKADWLMCEEICIPGAAEVSLALPVEAKAQLDPAEEEAYREEEARWPGESDAVTAEIRTRDNTLQLWIDGVAPLPAEPSSLFFFPFNSEVQSAAPQEWVIHGEELVGTLKKSEFAGTIDSFVSGILVDPNGWDSLDGRKALRIEAHVSDEVPQVLLQSSTSTQSQSFGVILLLAFAGGAILNLMPCVFPVLGLKIMGFVEQAGHDKRRIIGHGLLFTAGVLVSFWVLVGTLLALRAGGAELGWGFQLQSAPFVFGMAAFLLLFALNLSGVFEIGMGLVSLGSRADKKTGAGGSFLSGVLATIVATPCSAPILATALAGALALPPMQSFLVFTVIALGLSTPYLILSLFPSLLKVLPKPGAWMETLKQFMAFPLYATVGWLVYVLSGQVDGKNLLDVLLAFTLLALAGWIYGRFSAPHKPRGTRWTANLIALALAIGSIFMGYPRKSTVEWIPWSPETVAQLQEEERIIYVDFTARWCATCQVNKAVVFSSDKVLEFIAANDVALVKADWTNEDPAITRRLEELGKAAVPVNLVYQPGEAKPTVLPEVLTPDIVLRALQPKE